MAKACERFFAPPPSSGRRRPFLLILGPVGCGKTTLVQAYAAWGGWRLRPLGTSAEDRGHLCRTLVEELEEAAQSVRTMGSVVVVDDLDAYLEAYALHAGDLLGYCRDTVPPVPVVFTAADTANRTVRRLADLPSVQVLRIYANVPAMTRVARKLLNAGGRKARLESELRSLAGRSNGDCRLFLRALGLLSPAFDMPPEEVVLGASMSFWEVVKLLLGGGSTKQMLLPSLSADDVTGTLHALSENLDTLASRAAGSGSQGRLGACVAYATLASDLDCLMTGLWNEPSAPGIALSCLDAYAHRHLQQPVRQNQGLPIFAGLRSTGTRIKDTAAKPSLAQLQRRWCDVPALLLADFKTRTPLPPRPGKYAQSEACALSELPAWRQASLSL